MKALRIHEHGGPEVLRFEEAPDPPAPGRGQVLLEVRAASINHLDLWIRRGLPGWNVPFPRILGCDAAGTVAAVGEGVTAVAPGDRVCIDPGVSCGTCEFCLGGEKSLCPRYGIFGEHGDGTDGERMLVPEGNCLAIPDGMSFEDAAAAPLVALTAWRMVVTRGRVRPGETVLILGAGAGVGTMAIQFAKLCGARVLAAASTAEKLERCRALGADELVNYAEEDFAKAARRLTDKRGCDAVVDYVGKDTWRKSLKSLRRGGRLLTCGATTGYDPVEDIRYIFFNQLEILGTTMGSAIEFRDAMRAIFRGDARPVVDRVVPLAEAADAHRAIEAREVFGKVVLTP